MTTGTTFRLDGAIAGLAIKAPCRVATTANITLSGTQTIDGIAVVADDRVLVKDQTDAAENGIYVASATAWARAADFDGNRDVTKGTLVLIADGSTYYRVSSANPIVIGTSDIDFDVGITESSAINFLQAGAGAVARTLQDKGRDVVSPDDFAADGDGVADDDAELDLAEAAHNAIFLPNRSYLQTDATLAAEYYGPGHVLLPNFAHSPMRRGAAKALTPPAELLWTPPILPVWTPHGWQGNVSIRSLMPSIGSVAYYVDNQHGSDSASGRLFTITGATATNPVVISYTPPTGLDVTNALQVRIDGVAGMTQLNNRWFTLANVNAAANTVELSGIDGAAFGAYTSGGEMVEPLKGIDAAIAKADATVIYVAPGVYFRDDDWGSANIATSNASLVVLKWPIRSGPIISGAMWDHTAAEWTNDATYTNTWSATRSVVAAVRDYRLLTSDGEHWPYELAQSNQDCNNRRGTYYTDGVTLWIHTFDEDMPDWLHRVFLTESGATYNGTKIVYVEDIEFHGGNANFRPRNTGATSTGALYMKRCGFFYANGASDGNGLQVEDIPIVVLEECFGGFSLFDVANYHAISGLAPKAVEIRCNFKYPGRNRAGTCNASTTHDAASILRIGGKYVGGDGPVIADTGDSLAWNVGALGDTSIRFEDAITKAVFYLSGGKSFNYDCTARGGENSAVTTTSGEAHFDRFAYDGALVVSSGSIEPYVQV